MRALDLDPVQEPCTAADEHAAWKCELGQRLQAAFVDRACAVSDTFAAFEVHADLRVQFPALELVERRQVRVPVIERDDQPEVDLVVRRVIQESATFGVIVEWPTRRVHDEPFLVPVRVDLPDLLMPMP